MKRSDLGFFMGSNGSGPEVTPDNAIAGFLLSREVEGCSQATLKTSKYRIGKLFQHLDETTPGLSLAQINRWHVESYLVWIRNKGCSPAYVRSNYVVLRTFFKFCLQENLIPAHPMRHMKPPKLPKVAKPFLSEDQRDQLLAICPPTLFIGARNAAVVWLLWTTGMRLSELANLQLSDLDWEAGRIKLFGKGSRERHVPFLKEAKTAVWRYMVYRRDDHPCLWVTEERRPISKDGIDSSTQRLVIRAGLQGEIKDLHHIFRRTWAMRQIRAGIPLKYIQLIGGWESVTTLEGYVRAMDTDDALGAGWV